MTKTQKLKCLFGFHDYTLPGIKHTEALLCCNCKKWEYHKHPITGYKRRWELNENGDLIRYIDGDGFTEQWEYNEERRVIHHWDSEGYDERFDEHGNTISIRSGK